MPTNRQAQVQVDTETRVAVRRMMSALDLAIAAVKQVEQFRDEAFGKTGPPLPADVNRSLLQAAEQGQLLGPETLEGQRRG